MSNKEEKEQVKKVLLEEELKKKDKQIALLTWQIQRLNTNLADIRDTIAMNCFVQFFGTSPSYEKAAIDSYKAADSFLRIRDSGEIYENQLIEDLKEFVNNIPNDEELGKTVRKIYTT